MGARTGAPQKPFAVPTYLGLCKTVGLSNSETAFQHWRLQAQRFGKKVIQSSHKAVPTGCSRLRTDHVKGSAARQEYDELLTVAKLESFGVAGYFPSKLQCFWGVDV